MDYEAILGFTVIASADNSIINAQFVKDPEEAR